MFDKLVFQILQALDFQRLCYFDARYVPEVGSGLVETSERESAWFDDGTASESDYVILDIENGQTAGVVVDFRYDFRICDD